MIEFLAPYGSLKRETINGVIPKRNMLTVQGCEPSKTGDEHDGSLIVD